MGEPRCAAPPAAAPACFLHVVFLLAVENFVLVLGSTVVLLGTKPNFMCFCTHVSHSKSRFHDSGCALRAVRLFLNTDRGVFEVLKLRFLGDWKLCCKY